MSDDTLRDTYTEKALETFTTVDSRIVKLRRLMLIHSYIYYRLDTSIVSDDRWQAWAGELAAYQKEYNHEVGYYDHEFKDWDGSTGYHLPQHDWIATRAQDLVDYADKLTNEQNCLN